MRGGILSHTLNSDSSQRAVEEAWLISGSGTSGLNTPPAADSSTLSSCSHWLYICGGNINHNSHVSGVISYISQVYGIMYLNESFDGSHYSEAGSRKQLGTDC